MAYSQGSSVGKSAGFITLRSGVQISPALPETRIESIRVFYSRLSRIDANEMGR